MLILGIEEERFEQYLYGEAGNDGGKSDWEDEDHEGESMALGINWNELKNIELHEIYDTVFPPVTPAGL